MSTRVRLGDLTDSGRVVGDFCEAWKAVDLEAIVAILADDAVYQSGQFPEVRGVFEVRAGKISAWREYFDLDQHTKLMVTTISQPAREQIGGRGD
jgi:limonene-1,2-epoxide hydrolase